MGDLAVLGSSGFGDYEPRVEKNPTPKTNVSLGNDVPPVNPVTPRIQDSQTIHTPVTTEEVSSDVQTAFSNDSRPFINTALEVSLSLAIPTPTLSVPDLSPVGSVSTIRRAASLADAARRAAESVRGLE